jgi:FkbM family methyltransferase
LYQSIAEQLCSWQWHYYEIPETRVEGGVVFDCGAAEGLFALLVQDRADQVHCFEPLPDFRAALQRTFSKNDKITVVPVALGRQEGEAMLSTDGFSSRLDAAIGTVRVRVETIDGYCARIGTAPTYIKADLEGAEPDLLLGAERTIREHKPKIAITTYHEKGHAELLRSILSSFRPEYRFHVKGIEDRWGEPVLLHAW